MNAHPIMIPAIDESGTLYPVEKMHAHTAGLFHLAVSVFVFDKGDLLIQRRAASKYHCGGQWANTCCSHPHWGEDITACAHRRLVEELGFDLPLQARRVVEYSADVGNSLHEHEKVTMFTAEADRRLLDIRPNRDEVDEVRWMSAQDIADAIASEPEDFAPWFRIYMDRFPNFEI